MLVQVQVTDKNGNQLFELNGGPSRASNKHAKNLGKGVATRYPRVFEAAYDKDAGAVTLTAKKTVAKGDVDHVKGVVEEQLKALR